MALVRSSCILICHTFLKCLVMKLDEAILMKKSGLGGKFLMIFGNVRGGGHDGNLT